MILMDGWFLEILVENVREVQIFDDSRGFVDLYVFGAISIEVE